MPIKALCRLAFFPSKVIFRSESQLFNNLGVDMNSRRDPLQSEMTGVKCSRFPTHFLCQRSGTTHFVISKGRKNASGGYNRAFCR